MRPLVFFAAAALLSCSQSTAPPADVPPPPLPPPTRPTDVVAEIHLGQPRATANELGRLLATRVPLELGLTLAFGVDAAVMSAIDVAKPMDAIVAGTADRTEFVLVFTPGAQNTFRSTLTARFRLTPVTGLGERMDPRSPTDRPIEGFRCAIVGVPGTIPSRIVCANRIEALERIGRYAAYSAQSREGDHSDTLLEVDGASARTYLVPRLRRSLEAVSRNLAETAAEQRRSHERPPDFGDPEAIVGLVTALAREVEPQSVDLRRMTTRIRVGGPGVEIETDFTLAANGETAMARDALARATAPTEHPLATRLAPDSFATLTHRSTAGGTSTLAQMAVDSAIRVLGERVPEPDAARRDLTELFSRASDATVVGASREPNDGTEVTAVFALSDGGVAARAVLARVGREAWLRGLRLGDSPVTVTTRPDVLIVRAAAGAPTAPRPARPPTPAPGTPPPATPAPPRSLAIGVTGDALVVVVGQRADATFAAVVARAAGPAPSVLTGAPTAPTVAVLDVSKMKGIPDEQSPVSLAYSANRDGDVVVAHARILVSARAVGAIRRSIPTRDNARPPRVR